MRKITVLFIALMVSGAIAGAVEQKYDPEHPMILKNLEEALIVVRRVDEASKTPDSWALLEQTITTSGGSKRVFEIEMYSKDNGEKSVMKYLAPPRVKGQGFLSLENGKDIWIYFNRTGRIRHLASHMKNQKVFGSDFSFDDLNSSIEDDYNARYLGPKSVGKREYYKLELKPKKKSKYAKVLMWVDRLNYIPVKMEYYDKDGIPVKKMAQENIEIIDGHPTPMLITVRDMQKSSQTVMKIKKIDYKAKLEDDTFTTRFLKKK